MAERLGLSYPLYMKHFILVAALAACRDGAIVVDPKPLPVAANVIIEAASVQNGSLQSIITATLRNDGGGGVYYAEFGATSNVPNQPGPSVQAQSVTVDSTYRETIKYSVSGGNIAVLRIYSRGPNTAIYTRTGCRYLTSGTSC